MTISEQIAKAKTSAALEWRSDEKGTFAYPKQWEDKVPLKIRMNHHVFPDMPFLAKKDTVAENGKEYYCWVNSYGALSVILPNGEQLGLKPGEFEVIEFHPDDKNQQS